MLGEERVLQVRVNTTNDNGTTQMGGVAYWWYRTRLTRDDHTSPPPPPLDSKHLRPTVSSQHTEPVSQ